MNRVAYNGHIRAGQGIGATLGWQKEKPSIKRKKKRFAENRYAFAVKSPRKRQSSVKLKIVFNTVVIMLLILLFSYYLL